MPALVGAILSILILGLLLRAINQPHVVGYLLAGVILGPHGIGLVTDDQSLSRLGAMGVTLLLFFIGMEVSPQKLIKGWRVSVLGTLLQILVSVGCILAVGLWRHWPIDRIVLLGFVISLSSTAVVLTLLKDSDEMDTRAGQNALGILIAQDIAVIPMLIVIGMMGGESFHLHTLLLQVVGGLLLLALMAYILIRGSVRLPFAELFRKDHELQVFAALSICFGLALISGVFGLSTALGAFVGGIFIGAARETQWVHHSLAPLRVVFVALFFVSIGMLVNLTFLRGHWWMVLLLVGLVLLTNTFINAGILRLMRNSWGESIYTGALLAQIGEFSFVLTAVGFQSKLLTDFGYQMSISVISISLLTSPLWIRAIRSRIHMDGERAVKTSDAI
ncbi:MAG: cation:proton antiporter [Leptospirillia bacterium]